MRIDPNLYSPAVNSAANSANAKTAAVSANPAPTIVAESTKDSNKTDNDSVSLSNAGLALAQQAQIASQAGQQVLGDLTRQTLSSLGLTSKADAQGAKIEFTSFSYAARSSTSLSASHSQYQDQNGFSDSASLDFHSEQATEITGKGRITTADGRVFEFESQLQLEQKRDFSRSESTTLSAPPARPNRFERPAPQANQTTPRAQSPLLSVIDDILQRLREGGQSHIKITPVLTDGTKAAQAGKTNAPAAPSIAVGEPNPNAAPSTSTDSVESADASVAANDPFNLAQLQAGAARIAQQIEQFSAVQGQPSPSVAVAA